MLGINSKKSVQLICCYKFQWTFSFFLFLFFLFRWMDGCGWVWKFSNFRRSKELGKWNKFFFFWGGGEGKDSEKTILLKMRWDAKLVSEVNDTTALIENYVKCVSVSAGIKMWNRQRSKSSGKKLLKIWLNGKRQRRGIRSAHFFSFGERTKWKGIRNEMWFIQK